MWVCSEGAGEPWETLEQRKREAGFHLWMWRMRTDPAFPRASVSPFWTESADTEAAPCWKPGAAGLASALACPPPPTILLRSSCGNGEWGRRLGGAPGCVPLRGSPRGASGRGMFPQQPGDSAAQPPAPVGGGAAPACPQAGLVTRQSAQASSDQPLQGDPSSSSPPPELSKASRASER